MKTPNSLRDYIRKYPKFGIVALATFIDTFGQYLLFPFFGYFVTSRFDVAFTEIGLMFTFFGVGGIVGGFIGGALADKIGRKFVVIFGLVASALTTVVMPFLGDIRWFYGISIASGLLGAVGEPGRQAMVTDLIQTEDRPKGFGILRITTNLSAIIGPMVGGFLSSVLDSYLILFIIDAVTSTITAIIFFIKVPETKPETKPETIPDNNPEINSDIENSTSAQKKDKGFMSIIRGYIDVFKDGAFMFFLLISIFVALVYMQMHGTLSVYLLDIHSFPEWGFGMLLSINGLLVVILQFWISNKIKDYPPIIMLAVGTLIMTIGFTMFGFVSTMVGFIIAMVLITIGDMLSAPFNMSVAGLFAPEDKRGRYMAVHSFSWMAPSLFGLLVAGIIMDGINPAAVWYIAGILGLVATFGFVGLHYMTKKKFAVKVKEEEIATG